MTRTRSFKQPTPAVGFLLSIFLYNSCSNNNKTLTMKTKILTTTLLLTLAGCDQQPEQASLEPSANQNTAAQFEKSDNRISKFLDRLDDPNTPQDARIQILCKDYPAEYKINYMPALMELSPNESRIKLLSDLNYTLDYYKSNFNIKC